MKRPLAIALAAVMIAAAVFASQYRRMPESPLYLDVADPRNKAAIAQLGFIATPHFFFLRADGSKVTTIKGVVPRDSVVGALNSLLGAAP